MVTFKRKDDVLTLLIYLGYLAYNQRTHTTFIPNEEIRTELANAVEESRWNAWIDFQRKSVLLLDAPNMDEETVAEQIEKIHMEYTPVIQYNNANS